MIIIYILLTLIFIICVFLFYIEMLIKKHSTALNLIRSLNKCCDDLFMYSIPETEYRYTTKSKKEFDSFDAFYNVIPDLLEDKSSFFKNHNEVAFYKNKYSDYLNEFKLILQNNAPSRYFENHALGSFLKWYELNRCNGIKVNIADKLTYKIFIKVNYSSPTGKVSYTENTSYSSVDIINMLQEIVCNTGQLEQLSVSFNKDDRCHICGHIIKRKAYDWNINGCLNCVCPSCNRDLERKAFTLKKSIIPNIKDFLSGFEGKEIHATNSEVLHSYSGKQDTGMTVTQFIKKIKQPRGGYLSFKKMDIHEYIDGHGFIENENIHHTYVGLAVDCMTRFMYEKDAEKVFSVSLMGASIAGEEDKAINLMKSITGLNDTSISAACKLVGYDSAYRAGLTFFKGVDLIVPDKKTISNILIMVERSVHCFSAHGGLIDTGMTFEGGYTEIITKGDADFLTKDTIWDMKVSKKEPSIQHTLQIIIYYLLLKRAHKYNGIAVDKVGIFNPRFNKEYICKADNIPELSLIEAISGFRKYGNDKES